MKILLNILFVLSWFSALYCGTNENIYGELLACTFAIICVISRVGMIISEQLDKLNNKLNKQK